MSAKDFLLSLRVPLTLLGMLCLSVAPASADLPSMQDRNRALLSRFKSGVVLRVRQSAVEAYGNGEIAKWQSVDFDPLSCWDAQNNTIVIPAGTPPLTLGGQDAVIDAKFRPFVEDTGTFEPVPCGVQMLVNGRSVAYTKSRIVRPGSANAATLRHTKTIRLHTGDQIKFRVFVGGWSMGAHAETITVRVKL